MHTVRVVVAVSSSRFPDQTDWCCVCCLLFAACPLLCAPPLYLRQKAPAISWSNVSDELIACAHLCGVSHECLSVLGVFRCMCCAVCHMLAPGDALGLWACVAQHVMYSVLQVVQAMGHARTFFVSANNGGGLHAVGLPACAPKEAVFH